ncbi:NUDIX domain-containing protein, partial [Enterococcus faecalis]|uniref:NUDIX domain-containing protein n=1 Tax=Enterococcus faecalis TaxID=1351 RepID=UPI0010C09A77
MKKYFSRVFLNNQSVEILILKDRPDTWIFPGGKQELGESALECAIRDIKEELAVEITELEEIFTGPLGFDSIVWQGHF